MTYVLLVFTEETIICMLDTTIILERMVVDKDIKNDRQQQKYKYDHSTDRLIHKLYNIPGTYDSF